MSSPDPLPPPPDPPDGSSAPDREGASLTPRILIVLGLMGIVLFLVFVVIPALGEGASESRQEMEERLGLEGDVRCEVSDVGPSGQYVIELSITNTGPIRTDFFAEMEVRTRDGVRLGVQGPIIDAVAPDATVSVELPTTIPATGAPAASCHVTGGWMDPSE